MKEIDFKRWLASVGIFDQNPIRGFWGYSDTCSNRTITVYDTSFNEVYKFIIDNHFKDRVGEYQKKISEIFEI